MTGRQAVWVAALTQERDRLEDDLDRERANVSENEKLKERVKFLEMLIEEMKREKREASGS